MAAFINNNSALLIGVVFLGFIALLAWDHRDSKKALAVLTAISLVLAFGYLSARQGPSDVATIAEVDGIIGSGAPVVLEVYSDSCSMCLISNRSVDGLEHDLEGRATVLRLSLDEEVGRAAARRYGVSITPTFIVFTADGRERHRESGFPDTDRLRDEALAPA